MGTSKRPVKEGSDWCPLCKSWPNGDHFCPSDHPLWETVQEMHRKCQEYLDWSGANGTEKVPRSPDWKDSSTGAYNMGGVWLSAANMLQGAIYAEMNKGNLDEDGYIKKEVTCDFHKNNLGKHPDFEYHSGIHWWKLECIRNNPQAIAPEEPTHDNE